MKNSTNISSNFIAFLAVLILFVSSFSVSNTNNIDIQKPASKTKEANKKQNSEGKFYFSKTTIEAVFSQIIPSFDTATVTFLSFEFKSILKEKSISFTQFLTRQLYLEILFEHLTAPNAP